MYHRSGFRARWRVLLAAALLAPLAQLAHLTAQVPSAQLPPANSNDPVERLSRYLRLLSADPKDLSALKGAGRAALDVGDPSAAVGFFARAQEAAPRDGSVKAGLAAALVQLEQPRDALRLFDQAEALGEPVATFAADRGLAYDLRGDGRHAQEDYRRALAARPGDDEATRRLALSLAMSGDRAGALATLDPLLRRQDRAGWRASTFVLAITGDRAGADARVGQLMVPAQAAAMRPFLDRLAALKPAEQAAAVHFGHFPTSGTRVAARTTTAPPARPASSPAAVAAVSPAPTRVASAGEGPSTSVPGFSDAFAAGRDPRARASRRRPGEADLPAGTELAEAAAARQDGERLAEPAPARVASAGSMTAVPVQATVPPAETRATPAVSPPAATFPQRPAPAAVVPARGPGEAAVASFVGPPVAVRPAAPAVAETERPAAPPRNSTYTTTYTDTRPDVAPPPAAPAVAANPTPHVATAGHADAAAHATARLRAGDGTGVRLADASTPIRAVRHSRGDDGTVDAAAPRSRAAKRASAADASEDATPRGGKGAEAGTAAKAARTKGRAASEDEPAPKAGGRGKIALADADETPAKARAKGKGAPADADDASPRSRGKGKGAQAEADQAKPKARGKSAPEDAEDATAKGRKVVLAAKDKKAKDADAKKAARAAPERYWVQVAGGANKADLSKAWAQARSAHPQELAGKSPHTTPLRFTNRLLVGPFKSADEAQAFVNRTAKSGWTTFPFTSPAGQKVEPVAAK